VTETKERAWPPAGAGRPGDAGSGEPAGQGGAVPAAHRTTGFLWFLPMGITLAVSLRYDPRVARGGVDLAWAADAGAPRRMTREEAFYAGTTTVEAADAEGWVVSITPSGGWVPAVIAGRTGVGLSQRMQSFVLDPAENPFNVVEPGKRPRVTLTPTMALRDGRPFLSFAVQGGDSQEQNLLQFFLNVVEFGMTVQQATEAANFNTFQMRASFGEHESQPGRLLLHAQTPPWVRDELRRMGYTLVFDDRTSGPINAIFFDRRHGTLWGGSSNHGEDYGIAW